MNPPMRSAGRSIAVRVLILEDNPSDADLMVDALTQAGFDPKWERVETEADFTARLTPGLDLILSDNSLPQFSGLDALQIVRSRGMNVPFILVSGSIGEDIAVAAMQAGADDYLLKDRMTRLGQAARQALEKRRLHAEKEHMESALRESEERFRQIAENIREVFWLTDPAKNQILYVSPAYEGVWGRSCASLYESPQAWLDAIHPEDRTRVIDAALTRQARGDYIEEYRVSRPDGTMRWIRDRAFPVVDAEGKVFRIAGIAEDITDQKLAEQGLRESERRYRDMLGNVQLVSLMLGTEAQITYCNDYFLWLTGWQREQVMGRNWFELFIPPERDDLKDVFAALLDNAPRTWHYENEILTRSGGRRLIRWNNTVLRAASGIVMGTASIGEDITEQKEAENKIRRLNRVYALLSGINTLIVRVRERQELFREGCRIAVEHGGFGAAWIGLYDPATQDVTPVSWAGVDAEAVAKSPSSVRAGTPRLQGVTGRAITQKRPDFDNDIAAQPEIGGGRRREAIRLGYRSAIGLPLIVDGAAIGALTLYSKETDFFNKEELKLLTELANDITFALENMARQVKIDKLSRIRAVSSEINAAIVRIRDQQSLLRETCRIAMEHGQFELVWVASVHMEKQEVDPVAWGGFSSEQAHRVTWPSITATQGTIGEAVREKRPVVRNDITSLQAGGSLRQEALSRGFRSTVCLPLLVEDHVVALIVLFAPGAGFFDEEEMMLLNELTADVSFALEYIAKQERLDYVAYYDVLTGLPNRALINERLTRQLHADGQNGKKVALLVGDVNRFHLINESLGRSAGDALLRELASRMKAVWPEADNLARIAADYFAGMVTAVADEAEIARLLERIWTEVFGLPFVIGQEELTIAATMGIAVSPTDGEDAETLFRNAEAALKRAKASGERFLFYQPEMNAAVADTLLLENKMRRALEKAQFVLHYQPKINLASGEISGVEALIRWNDPDTGLVPPGRFIPILEETGLILEVGRWAICQALEDYGNWYKQGLQPPRIAVNVSAIQLGQKDFVEVVRAAIGAVSGTEHGLDLEITESLIMANIEDTIDKLRQLTDMGIGLAIDDFGTGYSSLGYLAKLPVNALKIDRSFIVNMADDPDSMAIVSTIISLAHSLSLKVIAEGVETEEQSKFLRLLKCDEIQGYLISRPSPVEKIAAMLTQARPG